MDFLHVFFVMNLLVISISAAEWSYKSNNTGPEHWSKFPNSMCAGFAQSPINLDSSTATFIGAIGAQLRIDQTENFTEAEKFIVRNNGHSLQITLPSHKLSVTLNKDSPHRYRVSQLHFHWGSGQSGSEHALSRIFYPLEMHIVSFDSKFYTSPELAANSPNGLAVIGVLFRLVDNTTNLDFMGNFSSVVQQIIESGSNTTINPFSTGRLLPKNTEQFYRYSGSLTTPPCTENVQWTVMRDTLSISSKELKEFRKLQFSDNSTMEENFRPIQLLNPRGVAQPRVVYKSWSASSVLQSSWMTLIILRVIQFD